MTRGRLPISASADIQHLIDYSVVQPYIEEIGRHHVLIMRMGTITLDRVALSVYFNVGCDCRRVIQNVSCHLASTEDRTLANFSLR